MTALSDVATPKEQRTAYQRWELDSFDVAPSQAAPEAVILPSEAQLARIHQQAQDEGYAAGYREGREQANAEAVQLQQIVANLSEELQQFDQRVADELLGLALAISKHVLRQELKIRPELILSVVTDVLGKLPLSHQRGRLILHPENSALVRQTLGERLAQSNWEIIESAEVQPGGCRVETAECEIDATLESRWQRTINAIGSDRAWFD